MSGISPGYRIGEDANLEAWPNTPPVGSLALEYLAAMPCTVCGVPYDKHGSFPTCATHPYTANGKCQHIIGAACVGTECQGGCVRAQPKGSA